MTNFSARQKAKTLIKGVVKRPFIRNVFSIASGTLVSQAIGIAFAPLITRLYGPENFGLQGIFMSVAGMLTTVAALSYPTSIVMPQKDVDALSMCRLSIYVGLIVTTLVTLMLALFGGELLDLVNAEEITPFIFLIPVAMIASVLTSVLGQWLTRKKAFNITAIYGVATAIVVGSTKTIVGFINPSPTTLITTNVFGGLLGTFLTYLGWRRAAKKRSEYNLEISTAYKSMWQLAKDYRDFPILRTPQNLINAISQSLPILLLASFFGPASAGQYAIAIAILGLPGNIIGASVMSVFLPKVTEAVRSGGDVGELIIKATIAMAISGVLPFLLILVAGPSLFEFIFGEDWRKAGVYAQLLSVWLFLQYINKPAVSAIPALRLQGGLLIYEIFSTGTKIFALWLGFSVFNSDIVALGIFSMLGVLAYVWLIVWVIKRSFNK